MKKGSLDTRAHFYIRLDSDAMMKMQVVWDMIVVMDLHLDSIQVDYRTALHFGKAICWMWRCSRRRVDILDLKFFSPYEGQAVHAGANQTVSYTLEGPFTPSLWYIDLYKKSAGIGRYEISLLRFMR